MKSVTKTFLMLCIALSVFMCNSTSAFAAVCEKSDDRLHHFSTHRRYLDTTYGVDGGTHWYLYGYDHNEVPIYKNDCKLTVLYCYCDYACSACGTIQEGARHTDQLVTNHSIKHNWIEKTTMP